MLGVSNINSILGTYFFFYVVLVWGIKKINEGQNFFSVEPLWGTYFLSRFFVKALCARSARFACSAPRPAEGFAGKTLWKSKFVLLPDHYFGNCFLLWMLCKDPDDLSVLYILQSNHFFNFFTSDQSKLKTTEVCTKSSQEYFHIFFK